MTDLHVLAARIRESLRTRGYHYEPRFGTAEAGIGAAWHLKDKAPGKTYAILERRDRLGGTWDLFKYPGIRSDSDMYTLGFHFKPWATDQMIADGPSIWKYVHETAAEYGIDKHIRYGHKVVAANWSDEDNRWELTVERDGEQIQIKAKKVVKFRVAKAAKDAILGTK